MVWNRMQRDSGAETLEPLLLIPHASFAGMTRRMQYTSSLCALGWRTLDWKDLQVPRPLLTTSFLTGASTRSSLLRSCWDRAG